MREAIGLVIERRHHNGRSPMNLPHPEHIPLKMETAVGSASRWNSLRAFRVLRWYHDSAGKEFTDGRYSERPLGRPNGTHPRFAIKSPSISGADLRYSRRIPIVVAVLLAVTGSSAQQSQTPNTPGNKQSLPVQLPQVKILKAPMAPDPDDAFKKGIMGKVVLRVTVDAKGRVTDAQTVSGRLELFQAALESVRNWAFEPPANAPVATTLEVSYWHEISCLALVSEQGEVISQSRVKDARGSILVARDDRDWERPTYFEADRKAGIEAEMTLSLTVNRLGDATNARRR